MKILVLNGSPRKQGTVATLLRAVADGASARHDVDWVDVYDLDMAFCVGCMKCRPDGECVLPIDGAHELGRRIKAADALVVGTPTHWGNMSSKLKVLFDRNVPVFMGERPNGFPIPRQKGKPSIMVTACTTPWPFNFIAAESRGALRALREVLHYGGYKIRGKVVAPGSRNRERIPAKTLTKAEALGKAI